MHASVRVDYCARAGKTSYKTRRMKTKLMFFLMLIILDWIVIEPVLIRHFGNFTHEYNIHLQLYLMLNPPKCKQALFIK